MKKLIFFCCMFSVLFVVLLTSCGSKSGKKLQAQTPPELPIEIPDGPPPPSIPVEPAKDFLMPAIGEVYSAKIADYIEEDWQIVGTFPADADAETAEEYIWIGYPFRNEGKGRIGFSIHFSPDLPLADVLKIAEGSRGYEKASAGNIIIYFITGENLQGHIHKEVSDFMNAVAKKMGRNSPKVLDWK